MTYEACDLCPRACGVDRTRGERGACRMTSRLVLARAALHHWEEPCISGTAGSGTVFFSGCPLGCVYCQNHEIADGSHGLAVDDGRLEEIFFELRDAGAHNINLVTPTHFAPTVAKAICRARDAGFALPFVCNTSGYESTETLRALDGLIDIYLTDLRYARPATAAAYSHAPDYPAVARAALAEMVRQTGAATFDERGLMTRGTIVRILLLPGHLPDAKLSLLHLAKHYWDTVWVSLMQQYTPPPDMPAPLDRRVTREAYDALVRYAETLGFEHAYTQEREAASESFIPPFDLSGVRKERT